MKEKIMWGAIIVTLVSWGLNFAYFQSKQLKEPIFLEHYYDTFIQNERGLTFYYLTNKNNPAEVVNVSIDGLDYVNVEHHGGGFMMWEDSQVRYEQEFRHHYLKSVTLVFDTELMKLNKENPTFSFDSMSVHFNNQSTITADIGQVNFHFEENPQGVFDSRISSSSNQHRSEEAMVAMEPMTVERIFVPFSELDNDVAVKVNLDQEKLKDFEALRTGGDFPEWFDRERQGDWEDAPGIPIEEDLFPFSLDKEEWLQLNMYFNPERTSYFEFGVMIEGKTESGKAFLSPAPIIDHPNLDQRAIDKMIAEKEGER